MFFSHFFPFESRREPLFLPFKLLDVRLNILDVFVLSLMQLILQPYHLARRLLLQSTQLFHQLRTHLHVVN
jgi:hypothetical protein